MKYFILQRGLRSWLIEQTDTTWSSLYYLDSQNGNKYIPYYEIYQGNVEEWVNSVYYTQTLTPTTLEQFIADNFTDML